MISYPKCIKCGYLLVGLATNRCPECGTSFDPLDRSTVLWSGKPRISPKAQIAGVLATWLMILFYLLTPIGRSHVGLVPLIIYWIPVIDGTSPFIGLFGVIGFILLIWARIQRHPRFMRRYILLNGLASIALIVSFLIFMLRSEYPLYIVPYSVPFLLACAIRFAILLYINRKSIFASSYET